MIVGAIIKPELGLRPDLFAEACYRFWLGCDSVKMEMAIRLVVTPLLHTIMERRKSALQADGHY